MANLSNINNKFIVTDGGNGRVLIGATNDIGATLFANHPSTTAPSLTFNAPAGQVFENEDLQIAFGLNNASPYNGYMQTRFTSAPYYRNLAINPLGGNVGIGTNSPSGNLTVESAGNQFHIRASTATAGKFWNFDVTSANQLYIINSANTHYLTIKDTGNVGIGTASPTEKLSVSGNIELDDMPANGTRYLMTNETSTGTGRLNIQAGGGSSAYGGGLSLIANSHASKPGWVIAGISSGAGAGATEGRFVVNTHGLGTGTDIFTVLRTGNVGIGATDPVKTLDVRGQLAISNSASSYWYLDRNDSTGNFEIFDDGDVNRLTIDTSGRVGIGVTPLTWSTGVGKVVDVLQLNGNGALFTRADHTYLSQNFYYNSADAGAVVDSGQASIIELGAGDIIFSGTTTGASSGATVSVVERMRITNSGNVVKPNSCAFSASTTTPGFLVTSTDSKITYNTLNVDTNNNYNTTLSRFTAPVAGNYLIGTTNTCYISSVVTSFMAVYIVKNGVGTSYRFRGGGVDNQVNDWFGINGSVIIPLAQGDYIELFGYTNTGSFQIVNTEGHFYGYLIG
jgi:hypothetical protein